MIIQGKNDKSFDVLFLKDTVVLSILAALFRQ